MTLISIMVNGTVLNFGKRYKDDLRVIFDHWPKLHLGLDELSKEKKSSKVSNIESIGLADSKYYINFNMSISIYLSHFYNSDVNYLYLYFVGLHGCIKRFKLGHRDVKIQSASEPLALRRLSLNECQETSVEKYDTCSHGPCLNGGTCLSSQ